MCGIIAVVRRASSRAVPSVDDVLTQLAGTAELLDGITIDGASGPLTQIADRLETADRLLRGAPGARLMLAEGTLGTSIRSVLGELNVRLDMLEMELDARATVDAVDLESVNATLIRVRDAAWSIERDRLRAADGICCSAAVMFTTRGSMPCCRCTRRCRHSTDSRCEVATARAPSSGERPRTRRVRSGDQRRTERTRSQRAVHELSSSCCRRPSELRLQGGGRDRGTRRQHRITAGEHQFGRTAPTRTRQHTAEVVVLGHTRWASVGIISEPNAHPINSEQSECESGPYCTAVLNGDVDNYGDLIRSESLSIADDITTDAKVIPTLGRQTLERWS